jgi:predicted PurR-regulated permease PerM
VTLLKPDDGPAPEDARTSLQAASRAGGRVPDRLVVASEWTWRMLVVLLGFAVLLYLLSMVAEEVIAVAIALLLAALLFPVRDFFARHGLRGGWSAALTLLLFIVFVAGLFTLVGTRVASGFGELESQVSTAVSQLQRQLSGIGLTPQVLDNAYAKAKAALSNGGGSGALNSALSVGSEIGTIATSTFIVLFTLFFFLLDGRAIWAFIAGLFPGRGREVVDAGGRRMFFAITGYVRATVLVAAADAVGVFIVTNVQRVPLSFPLAVIVFIGAFVPIVGTLASGTVAVAVAFVAHGPIYAILMLAGVLLVVEIEGHVLQPLLLGRAVRLHPLSVFLSITAGGVLAGIPGVFFAVPVAAALVAVLREAPVSRPHRHHGLVDWLRRKLGQPPDDVRDPGELGETREDSDAAAMGRGAR